MDPIFENHHLTRTIPGYADEDTLAKLVAGEVLSTCRLAAYRDEDQNLP
jgi:hypothetical protein